MAEPDGPLVLAPDDPAAIALVLAIKGGDVDGLATLLAERPELARARVGDARGGPGRSTLHLVADWPGHLPHAGDLVRTLVAAGADVDDRPGGGEAPLHWAASADDLDVLDALLDAGADIDIEGAVIAGGPPLADAVAFGQWQAARRLVERGARIALREAAALGLVDVVERHLAAGATTDPGGDVDQAFWYACHGGQPAAAALLAARGADLDWVTPWDGLSPLAAAERTAGELSGADRARTDDLIAWLHDRGARSAGAPA